MTLEVIAKRLPLWQAHAEAAAIPPTAASSGMEMATSEDSSCDRRSLLICATALVSTPAVAVATTGQAGVRDAVAAFERALIAGDREALMRLLAPAFVWVRGSGKRAGKAEFIRGLTAPSLQVATFRTSEVEWFASGDLAVLTAIGELKGTDDGQSFTDRHSFCDVWRRDGGRWKLTYAQVTALPA